MTTAVTGAVAAAAANAAANAANVVAESDETSIIFNPLPVFTENKFATTIAIGFGLGMGLGWWLRRRYYSRYRLYDVARKRGNITEELTDIGTADTGDYKMAICCRGDLRLDRGRLASEVAHAACSCADRAATGDPDALYLWKNCGQPKQVLKAPDESSLISMADLAFSLGLTASLIRGTGKFSLAPGAKTVLGIGPGPSDIVDKVVGHLKPF